MSLPSTQPHTAGWYPDPAGGPSARWWDGQGWTGRLANETTATRPPPLGPRFARLGDLLGQLLLANVTLSLLTVAMERLVHLESLAQALAVLGLALLLLTGAVWCAWQWRMAVSAPDRLRREPRLHIGAWFIPVANLWLPIQNIDELWHAYEPQDANGRWQGLNLVVPWWTCWVVSALLGTWGLGTLLQGGAPHSYLAITWALAAVLAWFVVRRLSWRALLYHAGLD